MKSQLNRRNFITQSVLVGAGATVSARAAEAPPSAAPVAQPGPVAPSSKGKLPTGRIGKLTVSRLISGGNLISGWAHSRDLHYVPSLMRAYNTPEKVMDTLQLLEEHGVNTIIADPRKNVKDVFGRYWKERGGKIQWIAQLKITEKDMTDIPKAVDNGAVAAYLHGGVGDTFVEQGKVDVIGKAVELIRKNGVVAGVAGHSLEVPKACEQAKLNPDFYMKTFNSKRYWSAGPQPRNDSVWEETPEQTKVFMEEVNKPWIAYKVLGAGAIHPREGFAYAYLNGADFICAGMFDFQVAEDVQIARAAIQKAQKRERDWIA